MSPRCGGPFTRVSLLSVQLDEEEIAVLIPESRPESTLNKRAAAVCAL